MLPAHIELPGLTWTPIDFHPLNDPALRPFTHGHDLFGDGSLVILPTPGHTPGSMSMLVRRSSQAPLLLVGDLTYDIHAFDRGVQSGVGSRRQLRRTRDRVLTLRSINPGMQNPRGPRSRRSGPPRRRHRGPRTDSAKLPMGEFLLTTTIDRQPATVFAFIGSVPKTV